MSTQRVSPATISRLPLYVQGIEALTLQGNLRVSSQLLAQATGVDASKIRKDLSHLGTLGRPGVGYDAPVLLDKILQYLGHSRSLSVALVGYGKLGASLAAYKGLQRRNLRIVAIFDVARDKLGLQVGSIEILPFTQIPAVAHCQSIDMAIIATPAESAQEVATILASSGIRLILNLAPVSLKVPEGVSVRNIDLVAEMQMLSFQQELSKSLDPRRSQTRRTRRLVSSATRGPF